MVRGHVRVGVIDADEGSVGCVRRFVTKRVRREGGREQVWRRFASHVVHTKNILGIARRFGQRGCLCLCASSLGG